MSFTIAQCKGFPAGTVVPKIEGTLKKVFPPKTGEGAKGPWKLQGFFISDGADEIKGTLWDSDDISYLQGKHVTLIASGVDGRTKKPKGVSVEANKQNGSLEISVSGKSGGIVAGEPNPAHLRGTPENAAASAASSAPSARSETSHKPAHTQAATASTDPVETLHKLSIFWLGCWQESGKVSGLTEEVRQAMTSSLYIEGCRQQLWRDWPAKVVPTPAAQSNDNDDVPF